MPCGSVAFRAQVAYNATSPTTHLLHPGPEPLHQKIPQLSQARILHHCHRVDSTC